MKNLRTSSSTLFHPKLAEVEVDALLTELHRNGVFFTDGGKVIH